MRIIKNMLKTLWHSILGLCRKPKTKIKLGVFASVTLALYITAQIASQQMENAILTTLIKWLWIPLSLVFLIIRHGEVFFRRKLKHFFINEDFYGFDYAIPIYIKKITVNRYIEQVLFKTQIPQREWEKKISDLEELFDKKIYKIVKAGKKNKIVFIFLIKENLPSLIEWSNTYLLDGRKFAIGEGYNGQVVWDASSQNHGLIAGSTNSGKTRLIITIVYQATAKHNYDVQVFDFKGGGDYIKIEQEHFKTKETDTVNEFKIISEPEEAQKVLTTVLEEVRRRLELFRQAGAANIEEYNALGYELNFVMLVFDEAAEIFDVKPKDKDEKELYTSIDQTLRTLVRLSRAAGVNILMGFIRPSHDVLNGQIKNNLLWRVCGYFADPAASKIVLDNDRATEIPPDIKGRFIVGEEEMQAYYKR